jgi:hypothetical protein
VHCQGCEQGTAPIFTQLVNFCWSLFKWCLLLAVAGGVVGFAYLYLRLDDEIRRQVERRIADHYPNLTVQVGRARFEQDRGISIFDVVIADGQPEAKIQSMLSIGEMHLIGKVGMDDLVTSDLAISEVVVRRATLRAVRSPDGRWNFHALMPLPQFGSRSPAVRIDDAVLIVENAAQPTEARTFQGIDLQLTPVANEAIAVKGTKHLRVEGFAGGVPARELRIQGELGTNDGMLDVTITVAGLEISSELVAALPGVPKGAMRGMELSGRAGATVHIHRAGANQPLQWSADDITFDRGRISHAKLPDPLTEIKFTAAATPERLTIKRLDANCGSAAIALAAERTGWSSNAPLASAVNIVGLHLDERLAPRMRESMARIWQRFRPNGTIDARLQLQFDGREWRPQLTANCRGISITDTEKFPYVVEQATGKVIYQPSQPGAADGLTLDLTGVAGGRPVRIEAELHHIASREPDGVTTGSDLASEGMPVADPRITGYRGASVRRHGSRPHPTGWVKISGADIPLHDQLIAAIPPMGRPLVESLHAQGAVDFTFRSEWKELSQSRASVTLDIGLKNCSIRYDGFQLPLRGIRGLVAARDWQWEVKDVVAVGAHDSTVVQCGGSVVPRGTGWLADLNFNAQNLPLDETLKAALSPGVQQAWDELRPQGRVDALAHVEHHTHQAKPTVTLLLRPRDRSVSLQLTRFPYRLEGIEGEAKYEPGRVSIRNVLARHDREVFSAASGEWNAAPDGGWTFSLKRCNIDRVAPHRELVGALPPRLQKVIERLQPGGTFDIFDSDLSFAKSPKSDRISAAWDVNLGCHQATLRGGIPLQGTTGNIRLFGRDDAQQAYLAGELDLDSVVLKEIQLTNVHGPIWVDKEFCHFGDQATAKLGQPSRRITADAYGGSLAGNIAVRHDHGPSYQVEFALGGADLERFANELGGPDDMNGTVSGRLAISGAGSSLQSLNGAGELHVVDANIYKLPLLVSMLKVPNLRNRTPDTTAFNRCDMKFTVQGDRLYFEQLNLLGDTVSLYGKGESGFDRRLNLIFYTLLEPAMPIPLWKTIAGQVSQQTLQLNVVGTWDDPDVQPETLPGFSQALEQIQSEIQGATSVAPSTATRASGPPQR